MKKYTRLFIDESRRYLASIDRSLKGSADADREPVSISDACRMVHSIRGMALFEEQPAIADLAFALEKGLARAAADGGGGSSLREALSRGVHELSQMIDEVDRNGGTRMDGTVAAEAIKAFTET